MMKAITITLASSLMLLTVSCRGTRGSAYVPDMPYTGASTSTAPAASNTPADEPKAMSDAQLLPPMDGVTPTVSPSTSPAPIPTPTPIPTPAPSPTPAASATPTYGSALMNTTTTASPTVSTSYAPVPSYTPPAATPAATGTILVAQKVPGDPHRVYNPYKPSQVIRITNPKTGEPFPSGKVLGIPNSTNKFMVP